MVLRREKEESTLSAENVRTATVREDRIILSIISQTLLCFGEISLSVMCK